MHQLQEQAPCHGLLSNPPVLGASTQLQLSGRGILLQLGSPCHHQQQQVCRSMAHLWQGMCEAGSWCCDNGDCTSCQPALSR